MKVLPMRRGFTLIELLVVVAILAIMAAILMPMHSCGRGSRESAKRSSCQSNLKQIGLGLLQYSQDYDEVFPRVANREVASSLPPYTRPFGWADTLYPYLRSAQLFQCPSEPTRLAPEENAVAENFTDYYLNSQAANRSLQNFDAPATTILCGDGNDGIDITDARYARSKMFRWWMNDEEKPPYRHLGGANYLFVDGHVKFLKPERITMRPLPVGEYEYTFSPQAVMKWKRSVMK
jgi:prepilin-type N-terminal cleavage/methylation domain-containing protein/prepilin-type processing-associated H-X9-DG protein